MLGGCDLVDDAKAEVLGEPVAQAVSLEAQEVPTTEEASPEPMLLTRSVTEVVQEAKTRSDVEPPPQPSSDLGRPVLPRPETEAEPFVPYDDGTGTVASAPASLARPKIRPRPRPRPRPEPLAIAPDEPCDPGLVGPAIATPPEREWQCLACGRG